MVDVPRNADFYKVLTLFEISAPSSDPFSSSASFLVLPQPVVLLLSSPSKAYTFPFSLFAFNAAVARYRNVYDEDFVVVLKMVSYVRPTVIYLTIIIIIILFCFPLSFCIIHRLLPRDHSTAQPKITKTLLFLMQNASTFLMLKH